MSNIKIVCEREKEWGGAKSASDCKALTTALHSLNHLYLSFMDRTNES